MEASKTDRMEADSEKGVSQSTEVWAPKKRAPSYIVEQWLLLFKSL